MSYDVATTAAGSRDAAAAAEEDIDQDIRSIMVANDNLVEQLAESVARGARKNPPNPRPANGEEKEEEAGGYESAAMDKLGRLVRETMMSAGQDNHRTRANRLNQSSSAAAASDSIEAPRGELAEDPSPSRRKPRINRERRPQKFYANCADLRAECEAGGQCALEPRDNDDDAADVNNGASLAGRRHHWRARCRCPIGRGGLLCEKREYRRGSSGRLPNNSRHTHTRPTNNAHTQPSSARCPASSATPTWPCRSPAA